MNMFAQDDYNKRLDIHIKDAFKNVLKPSHPCENQNKNCLKGSSCPLIGLPNDICTYHIGGKCKHNDNPNKCKYKHYDQYANAYRKAKQEFKMEEGKPLALIRRFLRNFTPHLMWLFGLIFSYFIRRILDYFAKKIF